MKLQNELRELIAACFTGIWVETQEPDDAISEIAALCREESWKVALWDIQNGLTVGSVSGANEASDPLAAIRTLSSLPTDDGTTVLIMRNLHRFVSSTEVMQALQHQLVSGKQNRTIIVALAPVVTIPAELEKLFVVVEHQLPDREQLQAIARGVAIDNELPDEPEFGRVLDAAAGLTRMEAENAFSLSLVRNGAVQTDAIWDLKTSGLKKSGLVELHRSTDDFHSLGGLESLKAFCKRSLLRGSDHRSQPRGVLLLGVPGTGKSAFAKALGCETNRPTLVLDVGALYGSLVGQTEQNIRKALQIADAMSPCILFIDEMEKALGTSSGQGDSGVSSRLFGTLLSWMNDHTSDVYLVATCNDISRLPPELTRAERFDAIMFLDLPSGEQRSVIWQQYLEFYCLDTEQKRPDDTDWTGAEIRSCCRLASLLDLPLVQAAQNVVPISATASESVQKLRQWADSRCLDAESGGVYQFAGNSRKRRRRAVSRASNN